MCTGKSSYFSSGAEDLLSGALDDMNCEVLRFCDFNVNPELKDMQRGLAAAKKFQPDIFITVGGGSVLDMGKLIRFFYSFSGEISNNAYSKESDVHPLIAIPTTAGTGSEATHFAVLYIDGRKYSAEHDAMLPDYAVLYPQLTYSNSAYLTACTGFDALAQAIEALWNKNATMESNGYATEAIKLLYKALPKAVQTPTPEIRCDMAIGAHLAGKAINITKTTAPHAFSYPFTAHYGIPHGHAVALTFPHIARINICSGDIKAAKRQVLVNLLNLPEDGSNILQHLKDYVSAIGLTLPAADYDIDILKEGVSTQRLGNNPTPIDDQLKEYIITSIIK